ncbi:MAG TPA: CoA transferase, partial [Candidatus Limnocylindrales bacterium]|nr:CoA transferase [Candidatus Limnocylindrales bacterium]
LTEAMELPDVARDPRYGTFAARRAHRTELLGVLEARFVERTTVDWLERLRGVVPIAPVRSIEEALDSDDLEDRGMLAAYDHPVFGTVRSVGLPIIVGGYEPVYRRGPHLGEDTGPLLARAGYSAEQIAELARAGAFGPPDAGGGAPSEGVSS